MQRKNENLFSFLLVLSSGSNLSKVGNKRARCKDKRPISINYIVLVVTQEASVPWLYICLVRFIHARCTLDTSAWYAPYILRV